MTHLHNGCKTSHRMIADNIPANTDAARDFRLEFSPRLPRQLWAMAVRYSLHLLEKKAPGAGVEVRVARGVPSRFSTDRHPIRIISHRRT